MHPPCPIPGPLFWVLSPPLGCCAGCPCLSFPPRRGRLAACPLRALRLRWPRCVLGGGGAEGVQAPRLAASWLCARPPWGHPGLGTAPSPPAPSPAAPVPQFPPPQNPPQRHGDRGRAGAARAAPRTPSRSTPRPTQPLAHPPHPIPAPSTHPAPLGHSTGPPAPGKGTTLGCFWGRGDTGYPRRAPRGCATKQPALALGGKQTLQGLEGES